MPEKIPGMAAHHRNQADYWEPIRQPAALALLAVKGAEGGRFSDGPPRRVRSSTDAPSLTIHGCLHKSESRDDSV